MDLDNICSWPWFPDWQAYTASGWPSFGHLCYIFPWEFFLIHPFTWNAVSKRTKLRRNHIYDLFKADYVLITCSYFLYSWCFGIWGLTDRGGTAPFPVSWFLETPGSCLSFTNQPIQSPTFCLVHTLPCHYSVLITVGPGSRQLEIASVPQSLKKLFKLANSKCAYPALTMEKTIKAQALLSLCSFCLTTYPDAYLCVPVWHGMSFPLGNC